ncbi:MAG: isoprenylcysteine carboxylmethyltransferase family protein [Pseudomonadota bacterium]|nr:isoprenylcysteine carboxylmethyltransferase family protein [Pseudomonadota bacterium]
MASALSPLTRSVRVAMTPQILLMVSKVYIPVLFPVTFLIALASLNLDRALGLADGFLPTPLKWYVAAASLIAGLLVVGITYAELVFRGEGSPSPTAGRTMKLVRTGIYAYCRNPSVIGKTLGVLAVGFALNSFAFCFVLVPILLALSLVEKVVRQEPQLIEIFGDDYRQYCKEVPLFIPWKLIGFRRKV